jgi:hypothetical protein
MTDNLRDRLIAVVTAASPVSHRFLAGDGYMSVAIRSDEDAAAIAVDAVIEALNLAVAVTYLSADKLRREVCVEGYYTVEADDV